jgi:glycosyltransferase involved in cell wall biosynthesis
MEKLAARRGLTGRMSFVGERTDVSALLPGLDVFAMASRYEGLPCAIVEAMAAARPVVATAVNAVPNIVVAGETGLLVPAGRPELLSRALRHLIDNPAVAARLGAAGRAHLGEDLTPAALGTVLDEVYRMPPVAVRAAPSAPLEVVAP